MTGAAVAAITSRVAVRAGSVVVPLHDPIRVAEEWSMVDNISRGRVGLAFASGWHAGDFAPHPSPIEGYRARRTLLLDNLDTVRRLWRGESVVRTDGAGERTTVRTYPRPLQPELPFWITSSGSSDTFRLAGQLGGNLLTHLLGQSLEAVSRKIDLYRDARAEHYPGAGVVTLMLHTHLGDSDDAVREEIRDPLSRYLVSSMDLMVRSGPTAQGVRVGAKEAEVLVRRALDRYSRESGLFGSLATARRMVKRLEAAGVDEVACLIDFGVPRPAVLRSLRYLAELAHSQDRAG